MDVQINNEISRINMIKDSQGLVRIVMSKQEMENEGMGI